MADIDLHKAYNSTGVSVNGLFARREEGFCVPLYQREYTWEEENINQLFDDIVLGILELSNKNGNTATTFLGTTILTDFSANSSTIKFWEDRARPTAIRQVIDGQQRFSTIALLAIQITERINSLCSKLPNEPRYARIRKHCEKSVRDIRKLYCLKLGNDANPSTKPKIIRANQDRWTFDGEDSSYCSPVAHYIAIYIRTNDVHRAFNAIDPVSGARVRGNIRLINEWLDDICDAHLPHSSLLNQFPVGGTICTDRMQRYVLGSNDIELKHIIGKCESNTDEDDHNAVALYHMFLLVYYLLRRCGFNCLQPLHEEWGFDMFQALNATGTPLTAMETFVPMVMQAEQTAGNDWTKTQSCDHMDEIEKLFEQTQSNEQKTRRTNELLSALALCYSGEKLGNKFSAQRRWITRNYEKDLKTIDQKRSFLGKLAEVAKFFYAVWYMEDREGQITGFEKHKDGEFVAFLVRYLKDANSRLSAPILARFYSQAIADPVHKDEFIKAAKCCAAFFTLWRSARSTSGLDDIYRRFFREYSWGAHPERISSDVLRDFFRKELEERQIAAKDAWIAASDRYLRYTEVKNICRFVLFVAGHDRDPDDANLGLTVPGTRGVCELLKLDRWVARDHKSLEHIAPQHPPKNHSWDVEIYNEDKVHQIGNLVLSPIDLNKFADNKEWPAKFLHYSHIGKRKKADIENLRDEAAKRGIVISKKAARVLSDARFNCAVAPILKLGIDGEWDANLVTRRTLQIKEIAWEMLSSWLRS